MCIIVIINNPVFTIPVDLLKYVFNKSYIFQSICKNTCGENVPVVDKDYYVELYGAYVL